VNRTLSSPRFSSRRLLCRRSVVTFRGTVLHRSVHLRQLRHRVSERASAFHQLRAFLIERAQQHLADCGRFNNQPIKVSYLFMGELPPALRLRPSRRAVEQYAHISDPESDPLGKTNDRQPFQGDLVVAPAPVHPRCFRQQSDLFVVSDRGGSYPAPACQFANAQVGYDRFLLT
jgi:hypothetical protein